MTRPTKKLIRSIIPNVWRDNYAIAKAIRPQAGWVKYDIYTYRAGTFQAIEQALRLSPFNWRVNLHYPAIQVSNY
jgi:hypothetical protein